MKWKNTAKRILAGIPLKRAEALEILQSPDDALLAVLDGAFTLRKHFFGRGVQLHVIRNARSGYLTTGGQGYQADLAMIPAAGFYVSDKIC